MKVHFLIAERSLSYAKIVPVSAMKVYFLIAERSLSYAKIVKKFICYSEFPFLIERYNAFSAKYFRISQTQGFNEVLLINNIGSFFSF